jgi:hypothetical protein
MRLGAGRLWSGVGFVDVVSADGDGAMVGASVRPLQGERLIIRIMNFFSLVQSVAET